MQRLMVIGRIGKDAETRVLDNGAIAVSFDVAVTEKYGKSETTNWYNATIWRTKEQGDNISQYIRKGDNIFIEGTPSAKAYTNKEGKLVASIAVSVKNFTLLGSKKEDKEDDGMPF